MGYDPIKIAYRKSPPFSINVDFLDLAQGVGIKNFYAGDTRDGTTYTLTSNNNFTSSIGSTGMNDTGLDIDFDFLFKKVITVGGETIITLPVSYGNTSGIAVAVSFLVTIFVRKWDGSTETDLVTTAFTYAPNASLGANAAENDRVAMDAIIPDTLFQDGESLRLSVVFGNPSSNDVAVGLGHDPAGIAINPNPAAKAGINASTWDNPPVLIFPVPMRVEV